MLRNDFDIRLPDVKIPKVKLPKLKGLDYKVSSREPLPAKIKNAVRERAKNTCEYRGCRYKENLQFHHKNMRNSDNRLSNIELLCPNHHAKRHNAKIRKIIGRDIFTGKKITRLVKKTGKKTSNKKKRKTTGKKPKHNRSKPMNPFGVKLPKVKIPKIDYPKF